MEAKKNPSKDIYAHSGKFFLVGLSISISLVLVAFQWKTEKVIVIPPPQAYHDPIMELIEIQATTQEPPSPQPAEPIKPKNNLSVQVESKKFVSVPDLLNTVDPLPDIDRPIGPIVQLDQPEETDIVEIFPEVPARPIGGYEAFYALVKKNIKRPGIGVEGKVYVEFVISKTGEPTDLKVIRGINNACDKEVVRVIALSRWEPGRQRGKPVRVRMVLPVSFVVSQD